VALAVYDDPQMLAPPATTRTELPGGGFVLRSPVPLQPYARCVGEWLEHWARETPDHPAFAERGADGQWNALSYAQLRRQVGAVAQGLLDLRLDPAKPIVILSDNALDHLVLSLAAMHIGRASCTVSSAYSRLAQGDYSRLHPILRALDPALVYGADAATYAPGLLAAGLPATACFTHGAASVPGAVDFATLKATVETPAVMQAFATITPETHAKYLLTSGSTGHPKVVINTHRMLCANQRQLGQALRFLSAEKPVLLDWLPWSHTFGGNHNTNIVLSNGGTMYIDEGRPVPGAIARTVANLREIQPTVYFNVPRGYDMLLPHLEEDEALARNFFGRLNMLFYAGAGMPQTTWNRLQAVAERVRSTPLWMTTSWGSTETAPAITLPNWRLDRAGVIGLPLPGIDLKLIPNGGKLEMRVRGPNIFPGYRHNEAATRECFDEEGYYKIGDAGYLQDPANPLSGIVFDGRVAEDFKLTTGTWVSVGTLRLKLVNALAPHVQDAVITGHDRDRVGAMLFLSEAGRALSPRALADRLREGLLELRQQEPGGSSTAVTRVIVLPDTPDMAAGEITDKGYVNQRMCLSRRAQSVQDLYAGESAEHKAPSSAHMVIVT
jgi:feruloyl-CoA synthase